jgi:hypothetical protein
MLNGLRHTAIVQPGGVIQVQSVDLPVGSTVEVIVLVEATSQPAQATHPLQGLSREQRVAKIQAAIGGWAGDAEISEIFDEIDRARHAYQGRALASFEE